MPAAKHSERFIIYVTKLQKGAFVKAAKLHDADSASDWARGVLVRHVEEDAAARNVGLRQPMRSDD